MDKKNYLWIGIGVIVVVIAVLLVMKTADNSSVKDTSDTTNKPSTTTATNNPIDVNGQPIAKNISPELDALDKLPLAAESVISVEGKTFSPKKISVQDGQKVFMTFSAKDEARHTFSFTDADLAFISVVFSKAEGDKSITFPAPKAGTYTYYIDDTTNTGSLTVK